MRDGEGGGEKWVFIVGMAGVTRDDLEDGFLGGIKKAK